MSASSLLRRIAVEGAFALGVLLLLLVILEGAARLLWDGAPASAPTTRPPAEGASGARAGLPTLHRTSDLARPSTRGLNAGALYETNRAGFRGPETPERKPEAVFRLAVIGDSTAMGWGVEQHDTYASRIERRLNSPDSPLRAASAKAGSQPRTLGIERLQPTQRFEVLNFALAGLDAGEVSKRFEDLALRFDPDLVIWGFTLNDIRGKHYRPSLDKEYAERMRRNDSSIRLWRWARPRWLALRELLFAPKGTFAGELDDNYFANPPAWQALESHFARIASLSDRLGICRVLLINSQLHALHALHPYRRHYEAVAELGLAHGFHPVQSLERMSREDASSIWVSPSDWHANARGHAILAELAIEALTKLPAACWDRPARVPLR